MAKQKKKKDDFLPLPAPTSKNGGLIVKVEKLEQESKIIKWLMMGVIIVFFVSFLAFVIDAFLYRADAYKEFNKREAILDELESIRNAVNNLQTTVNEVPAQPITE